MFGNPNHHMIEITIALADPLNTRFLRPTTRPLRGELCRASQHRLYGGWK